MVARESCAWRVLPAVAACVEVSWAALWMVCARVVDGAGSCVGGLSRRGIERRAVVAVRAGFKQGAGRLLRHWWGELARPAVGIARGWCCGPAAGHAGELRGGLRMRAETGGAGARVGRGPAAVVGAWRGSVEGGLGASEARRRWAGRCCARAVGERRSGRCSWGGLVGAMRERMMCCGGSWGARQVLASEEEDRFDQIGTNLEASGSFARSGR
jgi:hypothetical protein